MSTLNKDDVLLFANFSKDNQYQILNSLTNKSFEYFNARKLDIKIYSFFEIDKTLNKNYFFEVDTHKNTLTEYLSDLGLTQAHIFESIKESSMTHFLQGERKLELKGCDKYIIPTPKVDSYDMKPEMDSLSIAKTAIKCMEKDYDFILVNFANPDEVGHTGNYQATINGLQAIDVCLGKIIDVAEENFYKIVIVSSHGNADTIIDRDNNVITQNTLSPVPFMIKDNKVKLNNGKLTDFAPTLLKYMDIAVPKEMKNSEILLNKK
jgi:2,3-bisphosphoglycerate-independent phosphoglycerate mutase